MRHPRDHARWSGRWAVWRNISLIRLKWWGWRNRLVNGRNAVVWRREARRKRYSDRWHDEYRFRAPP